VPYTSYCSSLPGGSTGGTGGSGGSGSGSSSAASCSACVATSGYGWCGSTATSGTCYQAGPGGTTPSSCTTNTGAWIDGKCNTCPGSGGAAPSCGTPCACGYPGYTMNTYTDAACTQRLPSTAAAPPPTITVPCIAPGGTGCAVTGYGPSSGSPPTTIRAGVSGYTVDVYADAACSARIPGYPTPFTAPSIVTSPGSTACTTLTFGGATYYAWSDMGSSYTSPDYISVHPTACHYNGPTPPTFNFVPSPTCSGIGGAPAVYVKVTTIATAPQPYATTLFAGAMGRSTDAADRVYINGDYCIGSTYSSTFTASLGTCVAQTFGNVNAFVKFSVNYPSPPAAAAAASPVGAIVGGVVGGLAAVGLLAGGAWWHAKRGAAAALASSKAPAGEPQPVVVVTGNPAAA
jgi:hypothetical protein